MTKKLQFKRYSNTALSTIVGADGELIIDANTKTLTIHDGVTLGGIRQSSENFTKQVYDQANVSFTKANAAYNQANTANNLAQSAYTLANAAGSSANTIGAFLQANSAYTQANTATTNASVADSKAVTAGDYANSAYYTANSASLYANGAFAMANSAYSAANNVLPQVQPSFDQANGAFLKANAAYGSGNVTGTYANTAFSYANSAGSYANSAFSQANSASLYANGAFLQANAAFIRANTPDAIANSGALYANGAFAQANAAYQSQNTTGSYANSAYTAANTADSKAVTAGSYANSAYYTSNSAQLYANGAFAAANSKLSSSGGTVTGNVTIDGSLTVAGNINFTGNVISTTISGNTGQFFGYASNGFNALYAGIPSGYFLEPQVTFQISSNYDGYAGLNMQNINSGANSSSDLFITADNGTINDGFLDLGFASSNYNYTGYSLIGRNDGYLFATGNTISGGGNMIVGTGLNNDVIFSVGGLSTTNEIARFKYNTGLVLKNLPITFSDGTKQNTAAAPFAVTNAAFTQANTGVTNALAASSYANSAYTQANTATTNALAASLYANSSFTVANNAMTTSNGSIAWVTANAAFTQANNEPKAVTAGSYANSAFTVANNAFTSANGVITWNTANAAFTQANTANTTANNALPKSGGTITGNLAVTGNASFGSLSITESITAIRLKSNTTNNKSVILETDGVSNFTSVISESGTELYWSSNTLNYNVNNPPNAEFSKITLTSSGIYLVTGDQDGNLGLTIKPTGEVEIDSTLLVINGVTTDTVYAYGDITTEGTVYSTGVYSNTVNVLDQANTGIALAQQAYDASNSAGSYANSAFTKANNALANTGSVITVNGVSQLVISNTTSSTSTTTGALVVAGGVAVAGNTYIGNSLTSNTSSIANSNSVFSTVGSKTGLYSWENSGQTLNLAAASPAGAAEGTVTQIFFKPDGTKLFIVGQSADKVTEFTLSTPWNLSSASNTGSVSIIAQDTSSTGLFFKPDGTTMYMMGDSSNTIFQYTLSTPWQANTATYANKSNNVTIALGTANEITPNDIYFRPEGNSVFVVGATNSALYRLDLATPWDVSTITNPVVSSTNISALPRGLNFEPDGSRYYAAGQNSDFIQQFEMATPWDITTAVAGSSKYIGHIETFIQAVWVASANGYAYMVGNTNDTIYQYYTNNGFKLSGNNFVVAADTTFANTVHFDNAIQSATFRAGTRFLGTATFTTGTWSSTALTATSAVNFSGTTSTITITNAATTGTITAGGPSQTGQITLGQSAVTQTLNLHSGATTAGNIKTLNLGAGGLGGSTTFITLGTANTAANSTTLINGTLGVSGANGVNLSNGTSITAITKTALGTSYTSPPALAISTPTTPGGVQATATTTLQLGSVTGIVNSGGSGYAVGDDFYLAGGTFTTQMRLRVATVSGTSVATVTSVNGGEYTVIPSTPASTTAITGAGSGCTITPVWALGNTITITNAGSGYVEQPTVTFSGGGGSGAAAFATVGTTPIVKSLGGAISFYTAGGEQARVIDVPAANRYIEITGGLAGSSSPGIGTGGSEALDIYSRTNSIWFATNGKRTTVQAVVAHTASAVNYTQVTGGATGTGPTISSQGSDTNADLNLAAKNTGKVVLAYNSGQSGLGFANATSVIASYTYYNQGSNSMDTVFA
jgi:hypothetical protein